tara:strand:- start:439 stop:660 length:222 start_codon:yes stop_codon:yes gene_type:complete
MSELQDIRDTIEMLWQTNTFTKQINSVKHDNPEWHESESDKNLIFSLMGHQEFFSDELIKLKKAIDKLENKGE